MDSNSLTLLGIQVKLEEITPFCFSEEGIWLCVTRHYFTMGGFFQGEVSI